MQERPYAPSCDRNSAPILAVLQRYLGQRHAVLELGSGTGQHAVHFAQHLPWLRWQCSEHADLLPGIRQWLGPAGLANTPDPIPLQAVSGEHAGLLPLPPKPPGRSGYDAVFSANTLHIMAWECVQALFAGLPAVVADDALLLVYGPFNYGGQFSSDSNAQFDQWLKQRDPRSGVRDFEAVNALARQQGFTLIEDVAMPANNQLLVWRRG